MLVREPLEPVDEPRGDVVERRLVGVGDPLALDPRVEDPDVDVPRAALVGGSRDRAGELLLAGVRRHGDDLAGLDVGAVPDDELGEAAGQVGVVGHARQRSRAEWRNAPERLPRPGRCRVAPWCGRADQGRARPVNGAPGELNTFVEATHVVEVDGRAVGKQPLRHVLLNKPRGTIATARDPQGRPTVVDLVGGDVRVVPVGRLDRDTTGVLLLTNDGPLAHRLAHPRYDVEKVYEVDVEGEPSDAVLRRSPTASSSTTGRPRRRVSAASAGRGSSSSSTRAATARCAGCSRRSAIRS